MNFARAVALASLAAACFSRADAVQARPANVVVVLIDALRSDHLGCYGYAQPTSPAIDRLASQGVLFEQCYSPASWTLPATMSIFTGQLPSVHGCTHHLARLPKSIATLPQILRENGYYCAAVVSNPFLNAKYGFGRGFHQYDDFSAFLDAELGAAEGGGGGGRAVRLSEQVTGETVTRRAIGLLDRAAHTGRPVFLFVHYMDPHDSYVPSDWSRARLEGDGKHPLSQIDWRNLPARRDNPPPASALAVLRNLYDGEIVRTDAQVAALVRAVDAKFDPAETLVVLLSDHGEAFGEHGHLLHGNGVHREELAVPMIWRWSGAGHLPAGVRVKTPVGSIDVAKTLLEQACPAAAAQMPGRSLRAQMTPESNPAAPVPVFSERAMLGSTGGARSSGRRHEVAITIGPRRLSASFDREPSGSGVNFELYDLSTDPAEQKNLLAEKTQSSPPTPPQDLREAMQAVWAECERARESLPVAATDSKQLQLTEQEKRRLNGLGYLN